MKWCWTAFSCWPSWQYTLNFPPSNSFEGSFENHKQLCWLSLILYRDSYSWCSWTLWRSCISIFMPAWYCRTMSLALFIRVMFRKITVRELSIHCSQLFSCLNSSIRPWVAHSCSIYCKEYNESSSLSLSSGKPTLNHGSIALDALSHFRKI